MPAVDSENPLLDRQINFNIQFNRAIRLPRIHLTEKDKKVIRYISSVTVLVAVSAFIISLIPVDRIKEAYEGQHVMSGQTVGTPLTEAQVKGLSEVPTSTDPYSTMRGTTTVNHPSLPSTGQPNRETAIPPGQVSADLVAALTGPLISHLPGDQEELMLNRQSFSTQEVANLVSKLTQMLISKCDSDSKIREEAVVKKILGCVSRVEDVVKETSIICQRTSDAVTGKTIKTESVPMVVQTRNSTESPAFLSLIRLIGSMKYINSEGKPRRVNTPVVRFWLTQPAFFESILPEVTDFLPDNHLEYLFKALVESSKINGTVPTVP